MKFSPTYSWTVLLRSTAKALDCVLGKKSPRHTVPVCLRAFFACGLVHGFFARPRYEPPGIGRASPFFLSFFVFLGICNPSLAYVHPTSYVLKEWLAKNRGIKTLHIWQQTVMIEDGKPKGGIPIKEEIWIKLPHHFLKSSFYPTERIDLILGRDKGGRISRGKFEVLPVSEVLGPLGILYMYQDLPSLNATITQMGVDLTLARWVLEGNRQVNYEMGDVKGTRLKFSKESFLPLNFEGASKSYRYERGFIHLPANYPSVIELSLQGRLVERIEVQKVNINETMGDQLFDVRRLRSYPEKK